MTTHHDRSHDEPTVQTRPSADRPPAGRRPAHDDLPPIRLRPSRVHPSRRGRRGLVQLALPFAVRLAQQALDNAARGADGGTTAGKPPPG
jgi:hypothetical protein